MNKKRSKRGGGGANQALIKMPRQGRSRETLRRLVSAVTALLDEKDFDDISVTEIAKKGNASVGAFYARFKDKSALLDHLAGRFADEMMREVERIEGTEDLAAKRLDRIVGDVVSGMVAAHRGHRGVLRAVLLRSMSTAPSDEAARAINLAGPLPVLAEEIRNRRTEINHPDPETAVRLSLGMVASAIRGRILFPEVESNLEGGVPITDAVLIEELTRAVTAFLGVKIR